MYKLRIFLAVWPFIFLHVQKNDCIQFFLAHGHTQYSAEDSFDTIAPMNAWDRFLYFKSLGTLIDVCSKYRNARYYPEMAS